MGCPPTSRPTLRRSSFGEIRRFLYNICLPFEIGIHLLPIVALEAVDAFGSPVMHGSSCNSS